ncbi:MAG TPA: superoxide dismutase family protein [Rhodothermales bacterium]
MTTRLRLLPSLLLVAAMMLLPACADQQATDGDETDTTAMDGMESMDTMNAVTAQLQPTQGNNVSGTVTFTEVAGGVRVVANITGLQPGEHGFHVHETGDCSASDASSAGGHYSPEGAPHGAPTDAAGQRHMGDLGNIEADSSGTAMYERVDEVLALSGPNSIIGKAVIVHANMDDLESQPSGNAGARVACGIIMQGSGGGMTAPMDTASGM